MAQRGVVSTAALGPRAAAALRPPAPLRAAAAARSASSRAGAKKQQASTTLAHVPLCGRAVDLFIYGAAGLVTLQAAATLRDPSRLIPALPPQPTPAGGPTGSKEETLDAAKPPDEVMAIVRETLRAMELPESKVSTVLIGGTGFKSAGSLGTASGARLGIPVASLVRPLLPPHCQCCCCCCCC